MSKNASVIEYKCPCCNAGLVFGENVQKLTCEYCDNTFDIETVRTYNQLLTPSNEQDFSWDQQEKNTWTADEQSHLHGFQCPACGGEIVSDENTAATFCPFCDNPTILPARLSDKLKPDAVIPFQTSKEDAKAAFLKLCKGKRLLPKGFTSEQHLEKITGIYVPFWLYECDADYAGSYKATRIHHWSDSRYNYTKTDHFLLRRDANAHFTGIPMDGSSKMEDTFTESIEPYDYNQLTAFDMAYLSGFFADKYDIPSEKGEDRIRQRVDQTIRDQLQNSLLGYATVIPTSQQLTIDHSKAKYVLLPVWVLNTKYKDNIYTFAMNGQTGKMTGKLPVCSKRSAAWFAGICAVVTTLLTIFQHLL